MNATSFRLSLVPHRPRFVRRRDRSARRLAAPLRRHAARPIASRYDATRRTVRTDTARRTHSCSAGQGNAVSSIDTKVSRYCLHAHCFPPCCSAEFTREYRKILARKDEEKRESDGRDVKWRKKNDRPILEHSLLIRVVDADEGCSRRSPATSVYVTSIYAREVP